MVHIQNTSVACRTMMRSLRFEYVADEAIFLCFLLHWKTLNYLYITQWVGTSPGSFIIVIINDQISSITNMWYTIKNRSVGNCCHGLRSIISSLTKAMYKKTITALIITKNPYGNFFLIYSIIIFVNMDSVFQVNYKCI